MERKSKKIVLKKTIQQNFCLVEDFLQSNTKLDKNIVHEILEKGGFWLQPKSKKKLLRCRMGSTRLEKGDRIEMYYDSDILAIPAPQSEIIEEEKHWGVWYKPEGLLSQGTKYSDHASLLRQVELKKGGAYLVHRLDREARGVMMVAYTSHGASLLSQLWQEQKIQKCYLVEVLTKDNPFPTKQGEITIPLDGQKAHTIFQVIEQKEETSILLVEIATGRLHQIRRHMEQTGHPVIGDPVYGKGNKNKEGMMLISYSLEFIHPLKKKKVLYRLPNELIPKNFIAPPLDSVLEIHYRN